MRTFRGVDLLRMAKRQERERAADEALPTPDQRAAAVEDQARRLRDLLRRRPEARRESPRPAG